MEGNVPEIRLKGFTEPWEQRKFKSLINRVSKTSTENRLPRVEFEDIISGLGQLNKDINKKDSRKSGTEFLSGDILFGKLRPYLKNWLLPDFDGVAVGDFWVFRPKESDIHFIYYLIQSDNFQAVANLSIGTKMPRSDWSVVSEAEFSIPTMAEQIAIGEFFRTLDENITLHKQKLDGLKKLKKGYLQQMFPQFGETVPMMRFDGFSEPWEQRKLGEHTAFITKGTTPIDKSGNGEINFVKVENIIDGKIKSTSKIFTEEHNGYLKRSRLEEDDILFSIAGTLGRTAVVDKLILPANTNQALAIIRDYDFDTNFLITSFSTHAVSEFIKKNPTIGAQPNLSLEQIRDLIIYTPSRKEQTVIGNFFYNLDNQITAQNQKVEQLKQLKAAYLQKMFV